MPNPELIPSTLLGVFENVGAALKREHQAEWKAKVAEFGTVDRQEQSRSSNAEF